MMKTKEVIKTLKLLTSLLEASNKDIIEDIFTKKANNFSHEQLIVNIDTLIKLGSIDKNQWIDFAKANSINIDVRPRDASRDVLDKILKYIEKNPDVQKIIAKKAENVSSMHSPELTNALKILMGR